MALYFAQGLNATEAQTKIGMVVEGAYTCVSALQLGKQHHIELPIAQAVYNIIHTHLHPSEAVKGFNAKNNQRRTSLND